MITSSPGSIVAIMALNRYLLGAGGDGDLVQGVGEAVFMAELFADRRLQRRCAVERGVFGLTALDGLPRRLLHIIGRIEIGLAGAKDDHGFAFALHGLCPRADLQDFGDPYR